MNPYFVLGLLVAAILAVGAWQQKKKAALYELSWGVQIFKTLTGRHFLLQLAGFAVFIAFWQLTVKTFSLPWFNRLPGPWECLMEWLSPDPAYGISIYTEDYYKHILFSTYRATTAFLLATLLGVPLGLLMGWSRKFYQYSFPLVELIRPIPPLAWVPLAILVLPGDEPAVIFVTFLVAFFVTTLNTLLGVESIDESYFRAARCLGADKQRLLLDVVLPGAMPFIFTGLQISMGAAWFSLVAGEMIAAQFGLGFLIWDSYSLIQYPVIIIGMITLGIIGWASSAVVRSIGRKLMAWRERELYGSGQSG
ncbi:MAG: ABC transporter permease [Desulfarculus sp.]|jgi:NitT/TauT family transport system permease protein|nr:MAG: ABC transporter permease [Desulfarculus sp.]